MNNNIDSIEQDMLNLKISPKDPLCTPVFKTRVRPHEGNKGMDMSMWVQGNGNKGTKSWI